ncbi:hypothetical protein BGZ52_012665, partial [Haplosporangium bisporale]
LKEVLPDITGIYNKEDNMEMNDEGIEKDVDMEADSDAEGEGGEPRVESIWSIRDLYHGLVPQDLIEGWKEMFGTGDSTAQYMVERFVTSIEDFGRTEIWNSRCEATVTWEKTIGITTKNKKTRASSGNDNFNTLNLQHRKPEMESIHSTADNIVLESYLGQRRLHMMEKGGGVKFITSKVAG